MEAVNNDIARISRWSELANTIDGTGSDGRSIKDVLIDARGLTSSAPYVRDESLPHIAKELEKRIIYVMDHLRVLADKKP